MQRTQLRVRQFQHFGDIAGLKVVLIPLREKDSLQYFALQVESTERHHERSARDYPHDCLLAHCIDEPSALALPRMETRGMHPCDPAVLVKISECSPRTRRAK